MRIAQITSHSPRMMPDSGENEADMTHLGVCHGCEAPDGAHTVQDSLVPGDDCGVPWHQERRDMGSSGKNGYSLIGQLGSYSSGRPVPFICPENLLEFVFFTEGNCLPTTTVGR